MNSPIHMGRPMSKVNCAGSEPLFHLEAQRWTLKNQGDKHQSVNNNFRIVMNSTRIPAVTWVRVTHMLSVSMGSLCNTLLLQGQSVHRTLSLQSKQPRLQLPFSSFPLLTNLRGGYYFLYVSSRFH